MNRIQIIRFIVLYFPLHFSISVYAQYGYVKIGRDSIIKGYIRPFRTVTDAQEGLEVWKTKTDKDPKRVFKKDVLEYSIGKDTIKILRDFIPFSDKDIYYTEVEAHYIITGKINLLKINSTDKTIPNASQGMAGLGTAILINNLKSGLYLLERENISLIKAMPPKKEDLDKALLDFFSERFLHLYETKKGKINYKSLPSLIKFYNSKD